MSETIITQVGGTLSADIVLLVSDYVTIAVSLAIAYIAYQGYRRNDSRPMLFIAAGFLLAFGGPGIVFLVSQMLPVPPLVTAGMTQCIELLGMVMILYGFIAPARA